MGYKTFEDMKHNIPDGATHYRNECKSFLFTWFKETDSGIKFYEEVSQNWSLIGRHVNNLKSKMVKIPSQIETPEEKEALDMIDTTSKQVESLANNSELPNSSGWKIGDACSYYYDEGKEWRDGLYVTMDNGLHVIRDLDDDGYAGVTKKHLRKPESQEQKADRERLEAAYDLYLKVQERDEGPGFAASFKQFQDGMMSTCRKDYLSIVDITGYRKESK